MSNGDCCAGHHNRSAYGVTEPFHHGTLSHSVNMRTSGTIMYDQTCMHNDNHQVNITNNKHH